jgi:hypothetical protein
LNALGLLIVVDAPSILAPPSFIPMTAVWIVQRWLF